MNGLASLPDAGLIVGGLVVVAILLFLAASATGKWSLWLLGYLAALAALAATAVLGPGPGAAPDTTTRTTGAPTAAVEARWTSQHARS